MQAQSALGKKSEDHELVVIPLILLKGEAIVPFDRFSELNDE
jgi:hypothetical protein